MAVDFPNDPSPGATFTANSKTWTFTDGKWALNVSVGGVRGPAGVAIQETAPTTTDTLWVDTSDTGLVIVPAGGTTGQVLAKSSSASYDTAWATPVTSGDMALKADLASPTFTGTPTLPIGTIATTQTALDSSTKVATTAFVTSADALKADLVSPTFTGTPTLPTGTIATTQTAGNNTTAVATTAFVSTAVANLIDSAPATLNTLDELALALGDDANFATTTATAIGLKAPLANPTFTGTVSGITKTMVGLGSVDNTADTAKPVSTAQQTALDLKANLASPALTGTPTAPTPSAGTNTTQIATMASKPWNVAWGVVSYTSSTSSDTSLADEVEEVQLTGASFTAVSGRLYKVTYFEPGIFTNGGSGPVTARIRLTNISGTVLNECYEEFEVYYRTRFINLVFVGTIAAGTRNVVATLYYSGNTAYIGRGSERKAFLFVEDIGPA